MGGLTRDPETKQFSEGNAVTTFSLAVSEKFKTKAGEQRETVCYVEIKAWGRTCELCAEYLSKGRQVLVEGKLELEQWQNKEGEKRSRIVVNADKVTFLPQAQKQDGQSQPAPQQASQPADDDDMSELGDGLPF